MAVLAGVAVAVRLHIRRGDDLNARDGGGMTPLMLAASRNKGEICSLLLSSGADPTLTDPGGRNALAFARAAGAVDAEAILEPFECTRVNEVSSETEMVPEVGPVATTGADIPDPDALPKPYPDDEGDSFDLSGWEAEEDGPAPEDDGALAEAARVVHSAISAHVPIDTSEDWGDFDAFLPKMAAPLPKARDEEGREGILRVLRRALREGSVPDHEIAKLSENEDGSPNEAGEVLLRLVLGDMGAETDERLEPEGSENAWEEREADEDEVSEALAYLEETSSGRNEPMRLYGRDVRLGKLLTAEEEITLGQNMEEGLSSALDALASWPDGIAVFLSALERVRSGEIEVESISDGRSVEGEDVAQEEVPLPFDDLEDEDDGRVVQSPAAREFLDRAGAVKALAGCAGRGAADEMALRASLAAARLSSSFLAGLASDSIKNTSMESERFRLAVDRYSAARRRMTVSNLRLVLSVVKRYQGLGLPFEDLAQEGNIGLMKAVDRYDWHRGFRFSTYATWWIRQQVTRAVADKGKTIRTPVHVHNTMLRIRREADDLERNAGCAPTMDVLAERVPMTTTRLSALMARMEEPVPFHLPDSSGNAPGDCLVDDSVATDPSAQAERAALVSILEKMLAELGPREAEVLTLRFGLEDGDPHTLEETGVRYGVTRERIRQVEATALRKLAHPVRASILREFLGAPKEKPRKSDVASHDTESCPTTNSKDQDDADCGRTEEMIARLRVCGAEVVDGRAGGGQIVVRNVWHGPQTKMLIRSLLEDGFRPYPGMEYRK